MKYPYFNIFLLAVGSLTAEYPGDDVVWKAVRAFYNYDTGRSITILNNARMDFPENPTVHLTWAAARWLHSQAHDPLDVTWHMLNQDIEAIIPVYKNLVERFPNDPNYKLYLGSSIGLKARVYLGQKDWINTLVWGYRGFSQVLDVAQKYPEISDAQLPLGIVEYYAGMSNFLIRWAAAGMFELNPSTIAGEKKILIAAENGEWSWIEAKGTLVFIHLWIDPKPKFALLFSHDLVTNFPKRYYYRVLYTESLLNNGLLTDAYQSLLQLDTMFADLTDIHKDWYLAYRKYQWSLYHYLNSDYPMALSALDIAINNYGAELDVVLGNALFLKGKIYDILGDRKAAIKLYRDCIRLDNFTYAVENAKQYIATPFLKETVD